MFLHQFQCYLKQVPGNVQSNCDVITVNYIDCQFAANKKQMSGKFQGTNNYYTNFVQLNILLPITHCKYYRLA